MAKENLDHLKRRTFIEHVSKAGLFMFLPFSTTPQNEPKGASESTKGNSFLVEPYLQNMTSDGITIMWINTNSSVNWVEIVQPGKSNQTIYQEKNGLRAANNRITKVRIDGLLQGTTYQYYVVSKEIEVFDPYKIIYGETIRKGPFTFKTLSKETDEVSFVVLNDLHDHPENITELMGKLSKKGDYDFVVFNGDAFNWVDGEDQIVKDLLAPSNTVFSTNYPFLMVQGNHEPRGKFARQMFDYFDYPSDSCYYAFSQGPVRFIIMDSGEDKADDHIEYSGLVSFDKYREKQARWLEKEIQSKEFKDATFRVVFIHIPVFHSGDGHGTLHCRELFNPLFNKGKIDLSISGHTHRYGTFDADPKTHNYPIVIGGGPGFAGKGGGTRTIIKVKATEKTLALQMLIDDGTVVGEYNLKK
ncbi:putative purple acid phosphatase [Arcticibacter svalbardensis MN12-7]|uniref:Putative purple acid phosphatase n=1 Tax=Arcticibacter svalbardensis MN12-7 TaxID=1150600 RepID=R9GPL7_9SPHI|nr:metallophosphoesterase family protein [Arcticibacter svalbardensis]EOR93490.1 putative purple acid phosphatase [Arcticibacter svalbardensis MN12-7]